jgi:hypothetical protein
MPTQQRDGFPLAPGGCGPVPLAPHSLFRPQWRVSCLAPPGTSVPSFAGSRAALPSPYAHSASMYVDCILRTDKLQGPARSCECRHGSCAQECDLSPGVGPCSGLGRVRCDLPRLAHPLAAQPQTQCPQFPVFAFRSPMDSHAVDRACGTFPCKACPEAAAPTGEPLWEQRPTKSARTRPASKFHSFPKQQSPLGHFGRQTFRRRTDCEPTRFLQPPSAYLHTACSRKEQMLLSQAVARIRRP